MKFNKSVSLNQVIDQAPGKTLNHENGLAFTPNEITQLYLMCCACMLDDQYYVKAENQLKSIQDLCRKVPRKVLLSLAKYCRNEMRLRSISHLLLAEASVRFNDRPDESKQDVTDACSDVIQRVDDITEVIAYYITHLGSGKKNKLPNALKKGLAHAFLKFDEYQLAKYNRDGAVKLKDAVLLLHPKPTTPEQAQMIKRLLDDKLATPQTWEVEISTKGSTAETWNDIAPKMGIMAITRNLRNFEDKGAEVAYAHAISLLNNQSAIESSKMLPFRFLAAEREVSRNTTKDALRQALQLSIANLPKLSGKTLYIIDNSGSMSDPVTGKSKISCIDAASLLGAIGNHLSEDSHVIVFGQTAAEVHISKLDSVITNSTRISSTHVGHSTNAYAALELAINRKIFADRIILLSDMQCYSSNVRPSLFGNSYYEQTLQYQFNKYQKIINRDVKLFSIDLRSYGTIQFIEDQANVYPLAGYSERLLELIAHLESGQSMPWLEK